MPVLSISSLPESRPCQLPSVGSKGWLAFAFSCVQTSLTISIAAGVVTLAAPVRALQVQVTPQNPQQGDTLSVVVQLDNPTISSTPTVTMGQKSYPTFLIGANRFRALLPTTPLNKPGSLPIQVSGEGEVKNLNVQVRSRSFPVQRINLPPGKAGSKATQMELSRVAAFKQLLTPEKFWNGSFLKPNQGRISSIYGVRRYYNGVFANDYYHRGVDYAGGYGSPVTAPAAGRVALVGRESEGFRVHGNVVGIDHGQGVTSIFMHLSRINVKEGDFVQPGQTIGAIGSTGASTGPHLHWGLYVQGQSVDPAPWRFQAVR
ncbi:MAG: M23 family metallopeptidase [Aphanothece sp. CMT-3BRIN-NPC111]|jgi:lysostaphin|nr:M23 family metallopeptidase [Aphanothece sp. CMT-3BRIN-NPC111]